MINYLEIKIEPYKYADGAIELRTKVFMNGKEYQTRQLLAHDELVSFFEQIWERGGRELLAKLKEEMSTV